MAIANRAFRQRVIVLGSSVSLLVRPPRSTAEAGTYAEHLRFAEPLWTVENESSVSALLSDVLSRFHLIVTPFSPTVAILHFGINECAPRILPRRLFRYLQQTDLAESDLRRRLKTLLHHGISKVLGPRLIAAGLCRAYVPIEAFSEHYERLLQTLAKECRCQVICVAIHPTSERLETLLPGIGRSISAYNNQIQASAQRNGAIFVDAGSLKSGGEIGISPDGIHLSAEGHHKLAGLLLTAIREQTSNTCEHSNMET